MATLINGDGNQAVYAAQDADMLSGAITNNKTVILDVGEKFSADVLSSSIIEVHDGVILTKEGRRIQLDQNAVDLFEFPAGAQGVVSWYYIGYKLEIDEDSHQICSTFVQKMDSEGDTIPEGSFRDGDQEVYISLYHVQQDTLGVLTPTLVLTENMTMIDVLDNLIGSASDLPDPTKTVTKNIDQINSDLTITHTTINLTNLHSLVTNASVIETTSGNVHELKFDISISGALAKNYTLFDLVDADLPSSYTKVGTIDALGLQNVNIFVLGTGEVKLADNTTNATRLIGTVTYID
jgi:hypothetical protein